MDLKNLLNKEQYDGATTIDGQVLILAGAGSGKTRVLTYRMAHMIEDLNIAPYKILAITFTNKAAKEMQERVRSLIGEKADSMWISTFHSTCVRILRREIEKLGYKSSFTIYDSSDQKVLINECIKNLGINEKDITYQEIVGKIGRAKDNLQSPQSYMREHEGHFREKKIADVYVKYQKRLKENNALDFDDLICKTVELFKKNSDVLEFYQNKFQYIMVDEYQDTNRAQYELVKMLAEKNKNICVVGDDDQCLVQGSEIAVENGTEPIENIKAGDRITVGIGNGETALKEVSSISSKDYCGDIIKVTTVSGNVIKGTPSHLTFGKVKVKEDNYYVYLMYKQGMGYRIGQTSSVRSRNGEKTCGLAVRLNGEQGDKMWILKVCESKSDANYYEEFYSVKYGIPKCVFNARGRNLNMSQDEINKIFKEIDTLTNAERLMDEEYLYKEYPHHLSSAVIRGNTVRKRINLTFFGGKLGSENVFTHRIGLNSSGDETKDILIDGGFKVRDGQRDTFRVETERAVYDEAEEFAKKLLLTVDDFEIYKKAKLIKEESYPFIPLGSIKPGMDIAIYDGKLLISEEVANVQIESYKGKVYDINIDGVRNYISNNIVVHNCIYAWRGADITNILDFEKDYPKAKVIKLEQNYRSKGNILDAANVVIVNNSNRKSKALRTEQEAGNKVKIYRAYADSDEGDFVAREITQAKEDRDKKNKDFAILYRTNAQSRIFEEAFRRRGIAYKIVGGTRFYDRKEIKDMLAYLKVLVNPQDDISIKRIINVPKRSIGDATVLKLHQFAQEWELNLWDAISEVRTIPALTARNHTTIEGFSQLIESFMDLKESVSVSVLIESILKDTGYLKELEQSKEIEDKSRIENLKELVSDAVEFEKNSEDKSLEAYLEKVSLVQDTDKLEEEDDHVVLMTIHSAKGLEFPVVFMVGMENGLFPSMNDFEKSDQMEESRRLCYVGITRAREELYMTSAEVRRVFGKTVAYAQSDFINEIKSELKEYVNTRTGLGSRGSAFGTTSSQGSPFGSNPHGLRGGSFRNQTLSQVKAQKQTKPSFTMGDISIGRKVKHDKFGVGTIVTITPSGDDKKLTIAFDKQGIKVLMLSMANLEFM